MTADEMIIALVEDIDRDIEEREHTSNLRKLIAMLDRPALGYWRGLRDREAA